jgi:uncharacterized protein (DUF488 family)
MLTIWTIGHSTRSIEELVKVLKHYGIELLADVRRYPGSRRLPQFNSAELEQALESHGIAYKWLPSLGGRRTARADSPNTGWNNESFRGYADHTESEEFAEGLFELLILANGMNTAIMCAELLWWRCHRRIISDVLVSIGVKVVHIRDESSSDLHSLSSPARIVDGSLSYAADTQLGLDLLIDS